LDDYLNELKNNITPRHQKKLVIIDEIKKNSSDKNLPLISEIETIFTCAIFSSNIYQELSKVFKDDKYALKLIEYFKESYETCNKFNDCIGLSIATDFEEFLSSYNNLVNAEFEYLVNPLIERNKLIRSELREEIFYIFNGYLNDITDSKNDILENIDTRYFRKGIFRYNVYTTKNVDIENNDIILIIKKLEQIFSNPENQLNEDIINNLLHEFKVHKYYKSYEHEYLFYEGLNYLAKYKLPEAKENFENVCKICLQFTAGKTGVLASEYLIMLRLLTENRIGYSHLNPEFKIIIDSQSEEYICKVFPPPDKAKRNKEIYDEKVKKLSNDFNIKDYSNVTDKILYLYPENKTIIDCQEEDHFFIISSDSDEINCQKDIYQEKVKIAEQYIKTYKRCHAQTDILIGFSHVNPEITKIIVFPSDELVLIISPKPDMSLCHNDIYLKKLFVIIKNYNKKGYCKYNGIEFKKYNPFQKMDDWLADLFKLYDDLKCSSKTEEEILEQAVKKLMKGRNSKYPIKNKLITILQYSPLEALYNVSEIAFICYDLKVFSKNMERFFDSPESFIDILTKTIEKLNG